MIPRTDIHRPAAIIPADYEYVAQECVKIEGLGDCSFIQAERAKIQAHMARTGGTYSHHTHGGNCHICGSVNAIYTVLFYHKPTNSYIRTGQDCAAKLESSFDGAEFRRNCQNALEAKAGKRKALATLEAAGLSRAWEIATAEYAPGTLGREEEIIRSIVDKLVQYGSVSEKQVAFIQKLLGDIDGRAAKAAAIAAEKAAAADCPAGRVEITGTVACLRTEETMYGRVTKMLVVADSGFKVWGSRTACFEKGERVSFVATVEPSKDDPKFGFFKRPAKGQVLVAAPAGCVRPAVVGYTNS